MGRRRERRRALPVAGVVHIGDLLSRVDNQGHSLTYDGSTWSAPATVDPGGDYSPGSHNALELVVRLAELLHGGQQLG